jgi:uncharacterized protein
MNIEWDESKNQHNIQRRGLDFRDAETVLLNPIIESEDTRKNYSEVRWIAHGLLQELMVVIVYTILNDKFRIISMRMLTNVK